MPAWQKEMTLIEELEFIAGPRKIVACPRHCDGGFRGCDACNTCGMTGGGFYLDRKFYSNTEEGWKAALVAVRLKA